MSREKEWWGQETREEEEEEAKKKKKMEGAHGSGEVGNFLQDSV